MKKKAPQEPITNHAAEAQTRNNLFQLFCHGPTNPNSQRLTVGERPVGNIKGTDHDGYQGNKLEEPKPENRLHVTALVQHFDKPFLITNRRVNLDRQAEVIKTNIRFPMSNSLTNVCSAPLVLCYKFVCFLCWIS